MKTITKITAVFLLLLALYNSASAKVLTAKVTGVVSSVQAEGALALDGSISVGSEMTGFCVYDTDTPDMDDEPHSATYPVMSLSITIGNYTFTHNPTAPEPALWNIGTFDYNYRIVSDAARFNGIVYTNGSHLTYDDISWYQTRIEPINVCSSSNEYNLSDTLPESIPFSIFDWRKIFEVFFRDLNDNSFRIHGQINSLAVLRPFKFSPAEFVFRHSPGDPNPEPQILSIWAEEANTLNWQITEDCYWLDVFPCSGQSTGEIDEVTLSVNTSGLESGLYTCLLEILDPNIPDSTRSLQVNLVNVLIGPGLIVPTQYPTIQSAINDANDGDTVIVVPGTYTGDGNHDIDFLGKAITVRSTDPNDPNIVTATIINCNGTEWHELHRGFYFHSGEDSNSVLTGLTITNGYVMATLAEGIEDGGGIACTNSSPTITNCIITGNKAYDGNGGGIYCEQSSPVIKNCTITNNTAEYGGAIYCCDSNAVISGCNLTGNSGNYGGGIYCRGGCPTITNCTISSNLTYRGGGIYCYDSSPVITGCTISDNSSFRISRPPEYGGGICCSENSCPTITNCIITGNKALFGGGICCQESSPAISFCTITGNSAEFDGGGIYCYKSNPRITNCSITGNTETSISHNPSGGGIYCLISDPIIKNCTITNNTARYGGAIYCCNSNAAISDCNLTGNSGGYGGGIYCEGGCPTITNCAISSNSAFSGGGICCYDSSPMITSCTISDNSGSGIYCDRDSSPMIANCTITGNTGRYIFYDSHGGGIFCDESCPTITNCIISGNKALFGGGICYRLQSDAVITNCTITDNLADYGGGIYCRRSSNPTITNSILFGNEASHGSEIYLHDSNLLVGYSNVQGGQAEIYVDSDSTLNWGDGNIDTDPCFNEPGCWVDANDPNIIVEPNDPNTVWLDGDYHLLPTSPCIDAGDPNYVPEPYETDLDGNPRINGGRIDMGAFESIMHEARLWLWPRVINRKSRSPKWITAQLFLPAGITKDDVDEDTPLTLYPGGIQATYQFVMQKRGRFGRRTQILAFFNRNDVLEAIDTNGPVLLMAHGYLAEPGQFFYGYDTIRIIKPRPRPWWW